MAYEVANADMQQQFGHTVRGDRVVPIINLHAMGVAEDLIAVTGKQWIEYMSMSLHPGTEVCVLLQHHIGSAGVLNKW